jgi:hypothetical protein
MRARVRDEQGSQKEMGPGRLTSSSPKSIIPHSSAVRVCCLFQNCSMTEAHMRRRVAKTTCAGEWNSCVMRRYDWIGMLRRAGMRSHWQ